MKSSVFWDITLCSSLKVNRPFGATCCLDLKDRRASQAEFCLSPAFTLVSCLAYSSTLKMEASFSSETSVDFQRIARRYIPGDRTLHSYTWFMKCVVLISAGTEVFCGFPQSLQGNAPDEATTASFQIAIHQSFYYLTLYDLDTRDTMLQAGRSRVRFPMSLEFFN
jgi:hypothetical protein